MSLNSSAYWLRTALIREIQVQRRATYTANELRQLYGNVIDDLNAEIRRIFTTYTNGVEISAEEAERLINSAQSEEISKRLQKILNDTDDPKQREELIKKIHAQAYGARISRLEAVKLNVYSYFKEKANAEISKTKTLYNTVIEENYYRTVHDIAKGCNVGINFSLIPQRAIDEMLSAKWYGSQFSDKVWANTGKVAEQAQEIIVNGLLSHKTYNQMSEELVTVSKNSKYNARRLVRTQANHFMNLAEFKAYEDLGIEKYKYLATLDERTCEKCQPLDGKIFKLSEKIEGINYPTIHSHCRCTTTLPTGYAKRWARDPISGKGYKIKDMTYSEWIEGLTDKQKEAFEKNVKMYKNRSSDKKQYAEYINVLGQKNMPKTFDLFQDMKYNYVSQFEDLKYYYRNINGRPIEYVKIDRDLDKLGITNKGKAYPVEDIEIKGWRVHAEKRLKERNIQKTEALKYKNSAIIMMKKYPEPQTQNNYYSDSGVLGVRKFDGLVCTAYTKDEFKDDTIKILEEAKKWLK